MLDTNNFNCYYNVKKFDNRRAVMKLKEIRLSRNMTQNELAEKLNVERTTVTMWETKKSSPNLQTIKKLAEILNCKIEDLI